MALTSSIILCTRNRPDDIVRCLASIAQQTLMPTEIIVVDSSERPLNTLPHFQNQFSHVQFVASQLVYLHTRPGLTYQRNRGIEKAFGDIIYFFDDDVVLEKEYLQQMDIVFENNSQYAGGMGTITNLEKPSWRYQLFRTIFLLPRCYASGKFTWSGMPTHPYGTSEFKEVEVLGGCCMAFRKWALEKEQFDETMQGYCYMEDCDIARRISYHYPLFFNPNAKLQHLESPVSRDKIFDNSCMFMYNYSGLFFKNFYSKNKMKYFAKWWSVLGLFIEAIINRQKQKIKGYGYGTYRYWRGV